jgi:hypothetical protein
MTHGGAGWLYQRTDCKVFAEVPQPQEQCTCGLEEHEE